MAFFQGKVFGDDEAYKIRYYIYFHFRFSTIIKSTKPVYLLFLPCAYHSRKKRQLKTELALSLYAHGVLLFGKACELAEQV
jgi:hypothetical protein